KISSESSAEASSLLSDSSSLLLLSDSLLLLSDESPSSPYSLNHSATISASSPATIPGAMSPLQFSIISCMSSLDISLPTFVKSGPLPPDKSSPCQVAQFCWKTSSPSSIDSPFSSPPFSSAC